MVKHLKTNSNTPSKSNGGQPVLGLDLEKHKLLTDSSVLSSSFIRIGRTDSCSGSGLALVHRATGCWAGLIQSYRIVRREKVPLQPRPAQLDPSWSDCGSHARLAYPAVLTSFLRCQTHPFRDKSAEFCDSLADANWSWRSSPSRKEKNRVYQLMAEEVNEVGLNSRTVRQVRPLYYLFSHRVTDNSEVESEDSRETDPELSKAAAEEGIEEEFNVLCRKVKEDFRKNSKEMEKSTRKGESGILSTAYVAGYIAGRILKKSNCDQCRGLMTSKNSEFFNEFIDFKEYHDKQRLNRPSLVMAVTIGNRATLIDKILDTNAHQSNLKAGISSVLQTEKNFTWLNECPNHFVKNVNSIKNSTISIWLNWWINRKNRSFSDDKRKVKEKMD
ncbi:unnamed protein product [Bemisia tabaci]|uniref:Uncharacterized protein n=1 Tax=Bemisia tabaci TaxID=7038 RepID=A0A9P0AIM6_BEMTA|nr:unnamed protein product [Bemisia tabaci]